MSTAPARTGAAELTTPEAASLRLVGVSKSYDPKNPANKAVDNVSLTIEAGTFVTLLGPSGCGKTTTLRMIAGFEHPTEGDILLDGASIVATAPNKRPMSMVFQSYALFPHLSVRDNVAFGLKLKGLNKAERTAKVASALDLMGISQYATRYPHQLSGGQQQRVALARALVMEPKTILFDEPLSNLDARLRDRMREEIRSLQQRLGITAIFVTHDQSEALTMSDVVVVMSEGTIEQAGSPTEIYRRPNNTFVAAFLGTANFIPTTVAEVLGEGRYRVRTATGERQVSGVAGLDAGAAISLVARSENIRIVSPGGGIAGTVATVAFDGSVVNYTVATDTGTFKAEVHGDTALHAPGTPVALAIDDTHLWAIPAEESTP